MTQLPATLTQQELNDLTRYAEVLGKYIDPEIRQYAPIGWRKLPKAMRLEAESVSNERDTLQDKLGINRKWGLGRWKLEMRGLSESPSGLGIEDLCYWNILPLLAYRKEVLDFLAEEALPKVIGGRELYVRDTYVPAGTSGW